MPLLPVSELEQLSPVFRGKCGRALAASLRRLLSMASLSDLYDGAADYQGPAFARAFLEQQLGVSYSIEGPGSLDRLPDGPFVTVSNHPYGGLDGLALLDLVGSRRPDLKVMVNDVLSRIETLQPSWIVVDPKNDLRSDVTGKNIRGIKEVLSHLSGGHPVGFFPSGAVSDLSLRDRAIRDREWQEPLLRLLQKVKVPIVPVRFYGRNSLWYYLLGLLDWRIRILRLPREVTNKRGHEIRVGIGETLSVEEQLRHPDPADFGAWLRASVYEMK